MMSFDDNLKMQFDHFKIGIPNIQKYKKYLYADYVELVALFSNSDETSQSDILDRLSDEGISISAPEKEEPDEIGSETPEVNDKDEAWIREVFEIVNYRQTLFKKDYPFIIKERSVVLKKRFSNKNRLYLNLLIASNLSYFPKVQTELTSEFEEISLHAISNFLPTQAVVKQFGKNSDYTGTAQNKIFNLAKDMNIEVKKNEIEKIHGNQEKGLDIIAWIPYEDKIPNMLVILIQCACGNEWYKKQSETKRYENAYYRFYRLNPIHSMFIPYSLTEDGDNFYQSDEIDNKLLFERKRILENISDTSFYNSTHSKQIIQKCINYKEDYI